MLSNLTGVLTVLLTEVLTEPLLADPLLSVLVFGLAAGAAAEVAASAAADAVAADDAPVAGLGLAGLGLGLVGGLGGHAIQSRSNSSDTYHAASMGPRLRLGGSSVWQGCGRVVAGSRLIGFESDCVARAVVQVAVVDDAAHLVRVICMRYDAVRMRCAYGARCGMRAGFQGGARP